ncbi:glycosyltransferase family 39 protein [Prochlorococcus marinus XMU1412]|uniref:ArnT family glycosyltransferase n=1 Tax=Prochlorococcus marinus TaxID=1219 RepID=UPI001ADC215D|nr:glycosyltransferase family 39 protein [Prochlorococcus marinus]MBO8240529.1 glycosyltransferase family 39 protein [Prochlorococcus marinus XMU1412]MBW3071764.1 hypothetical protein [Prochlorococcus marinus str. MU1412]
MSSELISNTNNKNNYKYCLIIFFSFLTLYSVFFIIGVFWEKIPNYCVSDECAYFANAKNIFKGIYQDPFKDRLVSPGFSLVIAPFLLLDFGRRSIVFFNIVLGSFTIVITYLTSKIFLSRKISFFITIIWGLYYIKFQQLFTALTEPFASFLIISIFYLICRKKIKKDALNSLKIGFVLGLLLLTKPIFVYVVILLFILISIWLLFDRKFFPIFLSLILAFSMTLPYQSYTFGKTGKILFFSNISGESLYWMSTPYKGEMGDWNNDQFNSNCQSLENSGPNCNSYLIEKNHGEFFRSIENLNMVEKNQKLTQKAISNIKQYPIKYARNIINNVSRLFYNIPSSYFYQRDITILRLIPNSILFSMILFSCLISFKKINKYPSEMIFCMVFIFIYIALSSLVSAYARMLTIVVPFILIWSFYSINLWRNYYELKDKF